MIVDPEVERIEEVCGLYFRTIVLPNRGDTVAQHSHDHDHASYVGNGCVMAWSDNECLGTFKAGMAVHVKAGAKHFFEALMADSRVACVHSIESAESIKLKEL